MKKLAATILILLLLAAAIWIAGLVLHLALWLIWIAIKLVCLLALIIATLALFWVAREWVQKRLGSKGPK